ncbi:MAG: heparin lyase I family protein, partial [Bacteroidota bacterium]
MTFSISQPQSTYQVYARWNSGYKRSNEMKPGGSGQSSSPPPGDEGSDGSGDVSQPSNITEPVISKLSINGSNVTLEFVNFASPKQPEGGFELIVDGKRTGTSIIPRLYSSKKNEKMVFSISNANDRCYRVYARWNSGYKSSKEVCEEGGQSGGGSSSPPDSGNDQPNDNPDDGEEKSYGNVPSLRVLKEWNFNRSRPTSEGGVKFWGQDNARIESIGSANDNKAARFFMNTRDRSEYRTELVVTDDIPSSMARYFSNSRGLAYAKMGDEVIYQFRIMLSNKWDEDKRYHSGDGYTSIFEFKQDYFSSREKPDRIRDATFRVRVSKDKYNFVFRATNEPFSKAPKNKSGSIVQNGKARVKSVDASRDFGKWILWTVHVKWSPKSDGFLRVYKNNDLVYRRDNQFTAYDDQSWLGPYMK